MAGIDVCQKLSGVTLKLLAFERMLSEYPNHKDEVGLLSVGPCLSLLFFVYSFPFLLLLLVVLSFFHIYIYFVPPGVVFFYFMLLFLELLLVVLVFSLFFFCSSLFLPIFVHFGVDILIAKACFGIMFILFRRNEGSTIDIPKAAK